MKKTVLKILKSVLFYFLIIFAWYLLYCVFVIWLDIADKDMFVSSIDVLRSFWRLIFQNAYSFWGQLGETLIRLFSGYVLSVIVGLLLVMFMRSCKFFKDDIKSVLSGIQSLPNICWVPFAIILCGLDSNAVYFVIILGSAPAIALAMESSMSNIDPIYVKAGKTLGCNRIGMYTRIYIPASMPNLITGLKQGWAFSWRALMAGEMNCLFSASAKGLGYLMYNLRYSGELAMMLCIMIVLILIGVFFEKGVFGIIENKILIKRGIKREND